MLRLPEQKAGLTGGLADVRLTFFFFLKQVSKSPGWPQTQSIAEDGLELLIVGSQAIQTSRNKLGLDDGRKGFW